MRSSNAPYLIADFVNVIANSLVKSIYFCLAPFLNSDGFIELGFFQTPTRDRPRLSSAQCQIEVEGIIRESSSERSL